ncbi:MAG: hypothetical protein WD512_14010 [Candidatus Paceibacterota bacterium]
MKLLSKIITRCTRSQRLSFFAARKELRTINKAMRKATYEIDVAEIEELNEQRFQLISSLSDNKMKLPNFKHMYKSYKLERLASNK